MTKHLHTSHFSFEYIESNMDTPVLWERHCHAQFEMIGVLEGSVSIMLEGKNYELTENQATVIPPLCYHTITANKRGAYRRVTVLFDAAALPDVIRSRFLSVDDIAIFFSQHIEKLKSILQKEDPTPYAPLAEAMMIQSFYEHIEARERDIAIQTDEFLQKAITYIDRHLCEKILLDDLARCTSRSKSSFCHLFEKKMKISPKQYILQKKLTVANKLICDGMPPTAAAVRIGYENYSNFYRIYKKYFGKIKEE